MESITQLGVPVLGILLAGAMVWASLQAIKKAISIDKWYYIPATIVMAIAAGALIVNTAGTWNWTKFLWITWAGWIASHLLHKFYARYLEQKILKLTNGKDNGKPA
jgi:hypothetical protein